MTWVGMPVDIVERLERLGLSRDDRLLYVEGYLYAGQYLTDGVVTARIPRLSDHPDPDEAAARLVEVGVWEAHDDGYFVTDYFTANLTREEIDRRKDDARVRQERSRRHKADDHSKCIRGRYCPNGALEPVTRDVTRDITRESQDTYLTLPTSPDLPDHQGKVGQGEGKAGADAGRGSPNGSPAPASSPSASASASVHLYADPQLLGRCIHCSLPAKNAAHHPSAPQCLQRLAELVTDAGPITPTRTIDHWGEAWWDAEANTSDTKWRWQTSGHDANDARAEVITTVDVALSLPWPFDTADNSAATAWIDHTLEGWSWADSESHCIEVTWHDADATACIYVYGDGETNWPDVLPLTDSIRRLVDQFRAAAAVTP